MSENSGIFQEVLAISLKCPIGNPEKIYPVQSKDSPWYWNNDDVKAEGFIEPDEYKSYSLAQKAYEVAKNILTVEQNINRYINRGNL